jgi:hypothetical protein
VCDGRKSLSAPIGLVMTFGQTAMTGAGRWSPVTRTLLRRRPLKRRDLPGRLGLQEYGAVVKPLFSYVFRTGRRLDDKDLSPRAGCVSASQTTTRTYRDR